MNTIKLRKELYLYKNPVKAKILSGFFKTGKGEYGENDKFLGIAVPDQRKIANKYRDLEWKHIRDLIKSQYHEERLIVLLILVDKFKKGDPKEQQKIFDFYLKNTRYINNWDLVDLSAPYIIGQYSMIYHHPFDFPLFF